MCKEKLFLDAPCLGELEKKYLCDAIDSGYVSSVGPFVTEFEQKMAAYLGVEDAVAVVNGTSAIYVALHELGIGQGDEAIVPALTFVGSVNPVLYVGATPVIVDVDINTWNMDPEKIKKAITKKTKVIIPVHLYGNPCNMEAINKIAEDNNLYVIEDAAESLGATYKDKQTGTLSDIGCYSFNGNKTITTGGGGLIVSKDRKRAEHIRYLINQAKDKEIPFFHKEMGFNHRMTNIQAALGLAQLEQLEGFLSKKKDIFSVYKEILSDNFTFQKESEGGNSSRWLSTATVGDNKKNILDIMKTKHIPIRDVFIPLLQMPYLKQHKREECANAYSIYKRGLCLPSSVLNSVDTIKEKLIGVGIS